MSEENIIWRQQHRVYLGLEQGVVAISLKIVLRYLRIKKGFNLINSLREFTKMSLKELKVLMLDNNNILESAPLTKWKC